MKTAPMLLSLAVLLSAASGASAQATQAHKLGWLQGCWAAVDQERAVEEQWMAPRGKTMIGSSRTVQGASLVGYEFMMIREQGDRYAIEVRPSGRAPVVFNQVSLTDSSVVFENLKHGYPQKIGYRRDGENSLSAWIEGSRNGVSRRFVFPYRQVVCAGSA
ncbi:MAG: DUF6265 family protein [Burkholderiales bacterium]|nr:DUF6265 family protein [Burkholderiales bacterium]